MHDFETIDELEAWLRPLGYDAFWRAIDAHAVFDVADRHHCDRTVANGIATYETVLTCMKAMARDALVERHGLRYRSTMPPLVDLRVVH